jgi:hypothetical protein
MQEKKSTPLEAFHQEIRDRIQTNDQNEPTPYALNGMIRLVVATQQAHAGKYRISADRSSLEPCLTRQEDQQSFDLLILKTAAMFKRFLTKEQANALGLEIDQLEDGGRASSRPDALPTWPLR